MERVPGPAAAAVLLSLLGAGAAHAAPCPAEPPPARAVPDEIAIANLMSDYAALLEARDFGAVGCLFRHGALLDETGGDMARGADAVGALLTRFLGGQPAGLKVRRVYTNPAITVAADGRTATALSYLTSIYLPAGQAPHLHRLARYVDRFVRIDGRWWFESRQELSDWVEP
jgi:hypothetical protein